MDKFWEVEVRATEPKPVVAAMASLSGAPKETQPESYFAAERTREAAEAHAARVAVGMAERHPDRVLETFIRPL